MNELNECHECGEIPEFIRFQVDKTKPYLVTVVHDCKFNRCCKRAWRLQGDSKEVRKGFEW